MSTWLYPTSAELGVIEQQKLPVLDAGGDPLLREFPDVNVAASTLIWQQKDNYKGLQQVRGLNGDPPRVAPVGINEFMMKPGVYGEYMFVDEREMTERRAMGSFNQPIDVSDLVLERQDQLLQRRVVRKQWIIWNLIMNGYFIVTDTKGAILHTDGYTRRQYTASVGWSTTATATPLGDLRATKLLARGYSMRLDSSATLWINQTTANYLFANTNSADIYGKRTSGLANVLSLQDFNMVATMEGLPNIGIFDDGYYDDSGNFNLYIPDSKGVLIGKRTTGATLGDYAMTRNAVNPNAAPGAYNFIRNEMKVPPQIEVHHGHNGGPRLYFPSAIIVMNL